MVDNPQNFEDILNAIILGTDTLVEEQKAALISELVLLRDDIETILYRTELSTLNLDITMQQLEDAITSRFATLATVTAGYKARGMAAALADFDNVVNFFEVDWISAPIFTDSTLIAPLLTTSKITGVSAEVIADIEGLIVNGLMLEKTPHQLMLEVTNVIGLRDAATYRELGTTGISYKAERIVRTELMTAMNSTSHSKLLDALNRFPDLFHAWVSTGDFRTRDSHLVANGQIVAADKPFIVGGELGNYPLDPALPLRERANCRCREVPWREVWGDVRDYFGGQMEEVEAEIERREKEEKEKKKKKEAVILV